MKLHPLKSRTGKAIPDGMIGKALGDGMIGKALPPQKPTKSP